MTSTDEAEAGRCLAYGSPSASGCVRPSTASGAVLALAGRGRDYLEAIRLHQWLKNILVFLPMLAAHRIDWPTFAASLVAFVSFSLVASSAYVLNDLVDLAADRAHPRKRHRPLAGGRLPIAHGLCMAPALLLAGGLAGATVGAPFLLVMAVYCGLTTAYSLRLKRWPIVDIGTLAGLYALRVIAGAAATGIELSAWLIGFSFFFFLALAAVKRLGELVDSLASGTGRLHGRGYRVEDLRLVEMAALASGYVSVLIMGLYLNSATVAALYESPFLLWGICWVLLFWVSRIVAIARLGRMHDDPVIFAMRDGASLAAAALIVITAVAAAVL